MPKENPEPEPLVIKIYGPEPKTRQEIEFLAKMAHDEVLERYGLGPQTPLVTMHDLGLESEPKPVKPDKFQSGN